MFRLVTFLCIFVSTALAAELLQWRLPESAASEPEAKSKSDREVRSASIEINSPHIPGSLPSLGLTTGELKLFSGHALNLLKSKCPNVNHHTLFKLHKYIGKRIAATQPVPGKNEKLRTLLDKMMECSSKSIKQKVIGTDEKNARMGGGMIMVKFEADAIKPTPTEKPAPAGAAVAPALPEGSNPTAIKKKWSEMTAEEKTLELSTMLNHFEPQRKVPTTEKSVKPTEAPKSQPAPPKRNPIVGWLSNLMESVSSFFRGLFGFGGVRRARSTEFDSAEEDASPIVLTMWRATAGGEEETIGGRQAFLTLVDDICRIYCDTCPGENQSQDFKAAAKELLQFLFSDGDATGLDLAAKHYLNHEFLQSVQECGA